MICALYILVTPAHTPMNHIILQPHLKQIAFSNLTRMVYCDYKHRFFPYCNSWQIASAFYCAVNKAGALPQQVWRPATGLETIGLETRNRAGDQRFGDHRTGYPKQVWRPQVWRHATELETWNRSGDHRGLTGTTTGLETTGNHRSHGDHSRSHWDREQVSGRPPQGSHGDHRRGAMGTAVTHLEL